MIQDENKRPEERLTMLLRFCGKILHHGMGGKCSQDRILLILDKRGRVTQRELMDIVGIQSGSMSEIIGKIEEQGLLCRVKNEQDKRNVDVMLTEKGREEAKRVRSQRRELEERLYKKLSPEEKMQLITLLEKVALSWDEDEALRLGRGCCQKKNKGEKR